jgi:hypothetical protein
MLTGAFMKAFLAQSAVHDVFEKSFDRRSTTRRSRSGWLRESRLFNPGMLTSERMMRRCLREVLEIFHFSSGHAA